MDDIDSVTMAGTWKQDIVNNAVFTDSSGNPKEITVESNKFIPILLLGNKVDKVSLMQGLQILLMNGVSVTSASQILESFWNNYLESNIRLFSTWSFHVYTIVRDT